MLIDWVPAQGSVCKVSTKISRQSMEIANFLNFVKIFESFFNFYVLDYIYVVPEVLYWQKAVKLTSFIKIILPGKRLYGEDL